MTAAGTTVPAAFFSRKLLPVTPWTAELKVAVTLLPAAMPVLPEAGVRAVTVGAVTVGAVATGASDRAGSRVQVQQAVRRAGGGGRNGARRRSG